MKRLTLAEARLADALRYLRAFPDAPAAHEIADRLLAFYDVDSCTAVLRPAPETPQERSEPA